MTIFLMSFSISVGITVEGKRNISQWKGAVPKKTEEKEVVESPEFKCFPAIIIAPGWMELKIHIPSPCVGPLQVSLFIFGMSATSAMCM